MDTSNLKTIRIGHSENVNGSWVPSYIHANHSSRDKWIHNQNEYSMAYCSEPLSTLLAYTDNLQIVRDFPENFKKRNQKYFLWIESLYSQVTYLNPEKHKGHNFWPDLEKNYGQDIREGKAILVFSQIKKISESDRGDILKNNWFLKFHQTLHKFNIPPQQVVVFFPIPEIESMYSNFCQKRGAPLEKQIRRVCYINYFEMGWLQSADMNIKKGNFLETEEVLNHVESTRPYHYLCMNNEARMHRKAFYVWLREQNLVSLGLVSFLNRYLDQSFDRKLKSPFAEAGNMALLENFSHYENEMPKVVDAPDVYLTNYHPWPFLDTYFSILTERVYNSSEAWVLPTAKIYKTIHNLHPFLILGQPGLLSFLRSQGFETFPEFFDESYDDVLCPDKRFKKVCQEVERLCRMSRQTVQEIYNKILPKLIKNREVLESHETNSVWHKEINWLVRLLK